MRLIVNQNKAIPSLEVVINCPAIDKRVGNMIDYIRQYSASLLGTVDDMSVHVPLDTILYVESVDRRTFFYDRQHVFRCAESLVELEDQLENSLFVRISKSCIVNVAQIASTYACENRRLGLVLKNGERLIAGRSYAGRLRELMHDFNPRAADHGDGRETTVEGIWCSVLNNNKVLKFDEVPQRVVAITYGSAEMLCALGLEDRIVGIASSERELGYLSASMRERLAKIPLIQCPDKQVPTDGDLLALRPDFLFANYYYQSYLERIGCEGLGATLYITEGSVPGRATIESVYRDFFNLGKIFGVENRAVSLVNRMSSQLSRIPLKPKLLRTSRPKVFVYDSGRNAPVTAFGGTLESNLVELAGGENVFGDRCDAYGAVSWSDVARADPDVVIVHEYGDYLCADEKIAVAKSRPELRACSAVVENRFVVLALREVFPGAQNALTVEKIFLALFDSQL